MSYLKLSTKSILQVPIRNYEQDFVFIVNGEEFHTNKIVADLLSNKISKQHLTDPTINQIIINTHHHGNFNDILNLINFQKQMINENALPFVSEILEELQPEGIEIQTTTTETTIDNVIDKLLQHEKQRYLYSMQLKDEIDFLSSHFYELREEQTNLFERLEYETIESIINNSKLQLESEDQLVRLVNFLYSKKRSNSAFYEYVDFINIDVSTMKEFCEQISIEDVNSVTWNKLLVRMTHEINIEETERSTRSKEKKVIERKEKSTEIAFRGAPFTGIFHKLKSTSNINEELKATKSSNGGGSDLMSIFNSDNNHNGPCTGGINPNGWICIEVKNHQIIPTHYTVKTNGGGQNKCHPKSWVIEISNDNSEWKIIDEQQNCSFLNGSFAYHTFPISKGKQHKFKFIRMRLTDRNWFSNNVHHSLYISSFEVFGSLI